METEIQEIQERPARNVVGLIGFICSLVAISFFWYPIFGIINSIPGLVLSIIGKKREPQKLAKIGFIISLIAISLAIIATVVLLIIVANQERTYYHHYYY